MGVLIVFGYGPGISQAAAERFGREGYSLALVGRSAERLADGVAHLKARDIEASAYVSDASEPSKVRSTIEAIQTISEHIRCSLDRLSKRKRHECAVDKARRYRASIRHRD